MKTLLVICAIFAAAVALPSDTYNPKYDNFNAKELADNLRLLKSFGFCILSKGPCTPEGSDIKKIIPEALKTSCAKCTPKQRGLVRIVVHAFQEKYPEIWDELSNKEDPKGEYKESFNEFLLSSD